MADIFVSYSHHDRRIAGEIVDAFEIAGCTVDWDNRLEPGERYNGTLPSRIADAEQVVVIWSKNSLTSEWVRREARIAAQLRTYVPLTVGRAGQPSDFGEFHATVVTNSDALPSVIPDFVSTVGAKARRGVAAASNSTNDVRRAFHARRVGDFEGAADHLRWALRRFEVELNDPDAMENRNAKRYKTQTIRVLKAMAESNYCGRLMTTLAGESLLPTIDAVLELNTREIQLQLEKDGCSLKKEYLDRPFVRAGIVIRPGTGVDDAALVELLLTETSSRDGPLEVDCFLLIMSTSDRRRGGRFARTARKRNLDASCVVWRPEDGDTRLETRLLATARKLCEDAT